MSPRPRVFDLLNLQSAIDVALSSVPQAFSGHFKDLMKHRPCQFSGLRILLARVIGGDERLPIRKRVNPSMAET